ncbi:NAD-dependent histone deacetylase sir2 [Malassezia cuniculi]|uniref:NAD-dependent histone deacetylase sir2 n=1 Tax=Malassezia cuniculi TaxID=948313 RepID=A0AAF0ENI1_9BASI|nr:NAD-dependent histone deacetylase sir2 [Malassezia cuniculi]
MESTQLEWLAAVDDDLDSEHLDWLEEQAEREMLAKEEHGEAEKASDPTALVDSAEGPVGGSSDDEQDGVSDSDIVAILDDLETVGILETLRRHVVRTPERIVPLLAAFGIILPGSMLSEARDDPLVLLPLLKMVFTRILRQRKKLPQYNTVDDVLELLRNSRRIVLLCGAGISVSCGIPDFRSRDGIYAQLAADEKYELDDPSDMFDKEYFLRDPSMFFSFAKAIYPANFEPSRSHRFIRELEEHNKLLRMYSQNIDTLEQKAGIERVLQCHGSFATATCTEPSCRYHVDGEQIRDAIMEQRVPHCPRCQERQEATVRAAKRRKGWDDDNDDDDEDETPVGVLKPDITFFGEKLPDAFDRAVFADREQVDLIIVMGTSLKVAPVSDLLTHMPPTTPVVLINRTPITHMAMDVMLLGDSDVIVDYLSDRLGWTQSGKCIEPQSTIHAWLFPGGDTSVFDHKSDDDNGESQEE